MAPAQQDATKDVAPHTEEAPSRALLTLQKLSTPLLSTGPTHVCATNAAGAAHCWGQNDYGQVGKGGPRPEPTPVQVEVLGEDAKHVAAMGLGFSHTCALLESGAVRCWGSNEYRQLGDGTFEDSKAPVAVVGVRDDAVALAVAGHHACALIRDGSVRCWGSKMYEDGEVMGPVLESAVATPVPGLSSEVTQIVLGQNHACALRASEVMCWGNNSRGQLATTDVVDSAQPIAITPLEGRVTQLAAGDAFTCALTTASEVVCWGDDHHRQLGTPGEVKSGSLHTIAFEGVASGVPVQVVAGATHACARFDSGNVACWGSNASGELGREPSTRDASGAPAQVPGLSANVLDVQAGQGYTCVRMQDQRVQCWGWNMYGQLGRAASPHVPEHEPQAVSTF